MPRPRPHCVRCGPSSPSPKKGAQQPPIFHVCCGLTAGCIKMPLGTVISLGPGDIVLDWDPVPPKSGNGSSLFYPCLLWPNCFMDQDTTWYEGRLVPGHIVLDGDISPQKGRSASIFGPSLLWPNGCPSQLLLSICPSVFYLIFFLSLSFV